MAARTVLPQTPAKPQRPEPLDNHSEACEASTHRNSDAGEGGEIPPLPHIHTRLFYLQPDRRRRDEDNLILTAKPCWDGLVDAGVVPDDTSDYMTKLMPRIIGPLKNTPPAIWLEVWTVE